MENHDTTRTQYETAQIRLLKILDDKDNQYWHVRRVLNENNDYTPIVEALIDLADKHLNDSVSNPGLSREIYEICLDARIIKPLKRLMDFKDNTNIYVYQGETYYRTI